MFDFATARQKDAGSARAQAPRRSQSSEIPPLALQLALEGAALRAQDTAGEPVNRALADRSAGAPLDPSVRSRMEFGFGTSFGDVRVHTGSLAAQLATGLGAAAFTRGRDVYFGAGSYRPQTSDGNALLAHELAHTIQQRSAPASPRVAMAPLADASEPAAEREAADASRRALTLQPAPTAGLRAAPPTIQRLSLRELAGAGISALGSAATSVGRGVAGLAGQAADLGREGLALGGRALSAAGSLAGTAIASLGEVLNIPEPSEGDPRVLSVLVAILDSPAVRAIPGILIPPALIAAARVAAGLFSSVWRVMQNPGIVIEKIKLFIGGLVAAAPARAHSMVAAAARLTGIERHLSGIWRHLEPKLDYLMGNWWAVVKDAAWGLVWPLPGAWEDAKEMAHYGASAARRLWHGQFSAALDDLLLVARFANAALGRLYGWFFVGMVLGYAIAGGVAGAAAGGVGAIPGALAGAAAGAAVAGEAGEALLAATLVTEGLIIDKGISDLVHGEETAEQEEYDYEQIASGTFNVALLAVMAVLSALAVQLAKALFNAVRNLFKPRTAPAEPPALTPEQRLAQRRAAAQEAARVAKLQEGIRKLENDLASGKKTMPKADRDWIMEDPARRQELAYDPARGRYDVGEAKAALAAEEQGVLPRPVRRSIGAGEDFIDGAGTAWDRKWIDPASSVDDMVKELATPARTGENVLGDLSSLTPEQAAQVRARVAAELQGEPKAGMVRYVPAAPAPPPPTPPTLPPGAVPGGVLGGQAGREVERRQPVAP